MAFALSYRPNEVSGAYLFLMYYVYILSNKVNTVLYVGITNSLQRRIYEHKHKLFDGFTKKYNVNKLVYFEETADVLDAIAREKQLKHWARAKKDDLINKFNPTWQNLYTE